jgi:hypothetical protein
VHYLLERILAWSSRQSLQSVIRININPIATLEDEKQFLHIMLKHISRPNDTSIEIIFTLYFHKLVFKMSLVKVKLIISQRLARLLRVRASRGSQQIKDDCKNFLPHACTMDTLWLCCSDGRGGIYNEKTKRLKTSCLIMDPRRTVLKFYDQK